jgi:hypothetical protein
MGKITHRFLFFLKVFVNHFSYLALLVLPSGGVYVMAGKTKPACRSGRCANAGGLKLQFFFVRLVPIAIGIKTIWVGLSVAKVRSVCVKEQ